MTIFRVAIALILTLNGINSINGMVDKNEPAITIIKHLKNAKTTDEAADILVKYYNAMLREFGPVELSLQTWHRSKLPEQLNKIAVLEKIKKINPKAFDQLSSFITYSL